MRTTDDSLVVIHLSYNSLRLRISAVDHSEMDTERNHLALSMASTLASTVGSQQPQPQAQVHQPAPVSTSSTTDAQDSSSTSTKRGPGRPKGSTKKNLEIGALSPPKTKRPVGRPRKDGRPAGSVPKMPRGPGRPRKNFPADFAINTFPQQHQALPASGEHQGWSSTVSDIPFGVESAGFTILNI